MSIRIDPRVDVAFKKLLGAPENTDLLLDFLNCALSLPHPITAVEILNPITERDYDEDKLCIVDIKATDATGYRFQVEIQLAIHPALAARIVYTWAKVHCEQLQRGQDYRLLKPTFSIWLLDGHLIPDDSHHHHFQLQDVRSGHVLSDHAQVHVFELPKWHRAASTPEGMERWLYFFMNAGRWDMLPDSLSDPTMKKAMAVLKDISQHERDLVRYRNREDKLRTELTILNAHAESTEALRQARQALQEKDEQLQERDVRLHEKDEQIAEQAEQLDQLNAELARLRAQLASAP